MVAPPPVAAVVDAPLLALIPGLPAAAFAVLILVGRRLGRWAAWCSVIALACSLGITLGLGGAVWQGMTLAVRWPWLSASTPLWTVGFVVDGLTWLMLVVVTAIGTMIQIYSIGYMHGDPRASRFFAYLSLFCTAMLLLVLADHLVLLFVGWEGVGLCSYLLIAFWFEKPAAAAAGRKAFITTRIGDTGLLLGVLLLAWQARDLRFSSLATFAAHADPGLCTLISALLFLGAAGKSAQVPLHVWLPDAMEGPTPVSALIHAATMVAAGVYLVARTLPLFTPTSLALVLAVGLVTHLLAGTVALTQTDIKRVLAYSTISQLGLMFSALGLGAAAVGMFHLFTHAFFKALLFLGAGSVIHAAQAQDLAHLSGLRRAMPWTGAVFLVATLAACGLFPLSGFWSKDAILLEAQARPAVQGLLLLGAVLTAAYMTRLYLRCFEGAAGPGRHAHESPLVMVAPMAVLAVGAAFAGFAGSPWADNPLFALLGSHGHAHVQVGMLLGSTAVAALGIGLGWHVGWRRRRLLPAGLRGAMQPLYRLAVGKYYVDEASARVLIGPTVFLAQQLDRFDQRVIDRAVNDTGRLGWLGGQLKARLDRVVVDGAVNGLAALVRETGAALRRLQTGIIQQYLLLVVASVVVVSVWLRW